MVYVVRYNSDQSKYVSYRISSQTDIRTLKTHSSKQEADEFADFFNKELQTNAAKDIQYSYQKYLKDIL